MPLILVVGSFAVTSIACAFAGDIRVLIALRLAQAGIVLARAVVRDLYALEATARVFSMLTLVSGIAPVLAPVLGGQILRVTDWRSTFVTLGLVRCALLVAAVWGVRESPPPERRAQAGLARSGRQIAVVLQDPGILGHAAVLALGSALMFCYIVINPFVP